MPPTAKTDQGALALRTLQHLSARDFTALRANFAPDITLEWPFAGRKILTRQGAGTLLELFSPLLTFETFELTITHLHEAEPGTVILQAYSHGIFADDRPDYHNRYVFILTIAGGLVTNWREYFNPIEGQRSFARHPGPATA